METKICRKCGKEKPISDFYVNSKMVGGLFPDCKECVKERVRRNYLKNIENPEYVERERERGREKYRRLYAGKVESHNHIENSNTRRYLKTRGVDLKGKEIHHWDYNKPNDVFLLSPRAHKCAHRSLTFDKEAKMFRFKGELLDTASKHHKALEEIFSKEDYEIEYINYGKK